MMTKFDRYLLITTVTFFSDPKIIYFDIQSIVILPSLHNQLVVAFRD